MQGRYVILRVLMECGNDLVSIKRTTDSNGQPDLIVSLDRHKIESVGRPAIGEFLKKLQARYCILYPKICASCSCLLDFSLRYTSRWLILAQVASYTTGTVL